MSDLDDLFAEAVQVAGLPPASGRRPVTLDPPEGESIQRARETLFVRLVAWHTRDRCGQCGYLSPLRFTGIFEERVNRRSGLRVWTKVPHWTRGGGTTYPPSAPRERVEQTHPVAYCESCTPIQGWPPGPLEGGDSVYYWSQDRLEARVKETEDAEPQR